MSAAHARPRSSVLLHATLAGLLVGALTTRAEAQVLQAGDIVLNSADPNSWPNLCAVLYRVRGGSIDPLTTCGQIPGPRSLIIDQHGRIVFIAAGCPSPGGWGLCRFDPETGQLEHLVCIPYFPSPGTIPPGLPQDATRFGFSKSLHETQSLRITIDDDVNGGTPQVSVCNAYGFGLEVSRDDVQMPFSHEAFRYVDDEAEIEEGVSLELLVPAGPTLMTAHDGATYYSDGSWRVCRAGPDIRLGFDLETMVLGNPVSFSGSLRLHGQSEIVIEAGEPGAGALDNTRFPNSTVQCGPIIDDDVPLHEGNGFNVFSVATIEFVNGSLCAVSSSVATGVPYLFNPVMRPGFLNPFTCTYTPSAIQHYGPYDFFQDPPGLVYSSPGNSRIISGDGQLVNGKLWAIDESGYQVLASGLVGPSWAASYPPPALAFSSAALVIRIDAGDPDGDGAPPVNLMLVDKAGRRLGRLLNGTPVNDFGDQAATLELGPNGRIRVLALIDPAPGPYMMLGMGTGQGTYEIRGYLADTNSGGSMVMSSVSTAPGTIQGITANVTLPLGLTLSPPKRFRIR